MPVVAAVECRRQLPRRRYISIAIQRMADMVRKLLMDTREGEVGETPGGLRVEAACDRAVLCDCSTRYQTDQHHKYFHVADNLIDQRVIAWLDISEMRWQTKNLPAWGA